LYDDVLPRDRIVGDGHAVPPRVHAVVPEPVGVVAVEAGLVTDRGLEAGLDPGRQLRVQGACQPEADEDILAPGIRVQGLDPRFFLLSGRAGRRENGKPGRRDKPERDSGEGHTIIVAVRVTTEDGGPRTED